MRRVNKIIIHCAYTPVGVDIGFKEINEWHKERGFLSPSGIHCGYHYIIRRTGVIEQGRPESEAGAHCRGENSNSIGICLVGGKNGDTSDCNFTLAQYSALRALVEGLEDDYIGVSIHGHREFSPKTCPGFDVLALLSREA